MRKHRLSWQALTETHMKQPDQFMSMDTPSPTVPPMNTTAKASPSILSQESPRSQPHISRPPSQISHASMADFFASPSTPSKHHSAFWRFTLHTTSASSNAGISSGKHSPHSSPLRESAPHSYWLATSTRLRWMSLRPSRTPLGHTSSQAKQPKRTSDTAEGDTNQR